ncbi:unnamed protein product [Adineta ricciae]|nr:unnamed protein product [Adineta ricciae]
MLIEQQVFANNRCYTCGALVYDVEKKKTSNHIYHTRCFRCRICKRSLNASSLNEEGDDIYCENCYRKKQRGECSGLDFQRAAHERAQFIYNNRHPDQAPIQSKPRRPIQHDLSQHPSWTLRQLELQFLSNPKPKPKPKETAPELINTYQLKKSSSFPQPQRSKVTFVSPPSIRKLASIPEESPPTSNKSVSSLPILYSDLKPTVKPLHETNTSNLQKTPPANKFDKIKSRLNFTYDELSNDMSVLGRRHSLAGLDVKENSTLTSSKPSRQRVARTSPVHRRNFSTSSIPYRRTLK